MNYIRRTLIRRFLPKLNLTSKEKMNPAKSSLITEAIPPTPAYAPY